MWFTVITVRAVKLDEFRLLGFKAFWVMVLGFRFLGLRRLHLLEVVWRVGSGGDFGARNAASLNPQSRQPKIAKKTPAHRGQTMVVGPKCLNI